jgi:ABC transport system ATP-binding/permease protein
VLVLDQMGHLAFYGNPLDSIVHFKTLETHINSGVAECPACGTVNPETLFNILETRVVDEFGKYTDQRKSQTGRVGRSIQEKCPRPGSQGNNR